MAAPSACPEVREAFPEVRPAYLVSAFREAFPADPEDQAFPAVLGADPTFPVFPVAEEALGVRPGGPADPASAFLGAFPEARVDPACPVAGPADQPAASGVRPFLEEELHRVCEA